MDAKGWLRTWLPHDKWARLAGQASIAIGLCVVVASLLAPWGLSAPEQAKLKLRFYNERIADDPDFKVLPASEQALVSQGNTGDIFDQVAREDNVEWAIFYSNALGRANRQRTVLLILGATLATAGLGILQWNRLRSWKERFPVVVGSLLVGGGLAVYPSRYFLHGDQAGLAIDLGNYSAYVPRPVLLALSAVLVINGAVVLFKALR